MRLVCLESKVGRVSVEDGITLRCLIGELDEMAQYPYDLCVCTPSVTLVSWKNPRSKLA